MKGNKQRIGFVVLVMIQILNAQTTNTPDPCGGAPWTRKSKLFESGNVAIPGSTSLVSYTAQLEWDQKDHNGHICKLRNPKFTENGTKKNLPTHILNTGSDLQMDIEIEGFSDDYFIIDVTMVNAASYGAAVAGFVPNGTSTTDAEDDRVVHWTWKDTAQPKIIEITGGDDANQIQFSHESPLIWVTRVVDSSGHSVNVKDTSGTQIYPGYFPFPGGGITQSSGGWNIEKIVTTN
ncbi:MAG: hypothetical protein ABIT37_00885 [Luteolibacter sp.]